MDPATEWMGDALCKLYEGNVFFPSSIQGVNYAKRICAWCPVIEECATYALQTHIEHGIWGGLSERQRKRVLRGQPVEFPTVHPDDVDGPPSEGLKSFG